ncbi:response regulator [Pseudomonas syringae]|jgi:DNA-binding NtrC family response regulator|uniref:Response regulator n=1 Tax=Pseudomonas syringae TaxID=317 RepID=A0A9Q3ZTC3_PSESX|nr:response regulator [Pseudomonas syringae]MCF5062633.1 response regulator [Pseudomonas syringae]MCF5075486.1 response regulator [Pseudomonas syringae]MCF5118442.1 response regulator [Pseudomonas syringae]MCF5376938.1 response regulator [Pseudomonas syringae]
MNEECEKPSPLSEPVIVVEDDQLIRGLMIDILSEIGLRSQGFDSADGALIHMLSTPHTYPLVIADHGLPGKLKGSDFIAVVKARWPSTATILTSGYSLDPTIVPPSTTYLEKPWSMDELVTAVANSLHTDPPRRKM